MLKNRRCTLKLFAVTLSGATYIPVKSAVGSIEWRSRIYAVLTGQSHEGGAGNVASESERLLQSFATLFHRLAEGALGGGWSQRFLQERAYRFV